MLIVRLRNTHSQSFTQKHENKHNDQQICIKMKKSMEKIDNHIYQINNHLQTDKNIKKGENSHQVNKKR